MVETYIHIYGSIIHVKMKLKA